MTFREILKSNDMTCARLSRKLGVSRSLVSLWAAGKSTPKLEIVPVLAKLLSVSVEEIINCFI
ncbi:MAG: helix-turn-helix transcriptional regulator [Clostridia bacterium]|nr:helix-turn-helix transcriptional regulator [Clostridia bacterium]